MLISISCFAAVAAVVFAVATYWRDIRDAIKEKMLFRAIMQDRVERAYRRRIKKEEEMRKYRPVA
ncbi:MAG: hypothetical protein AAF732_15460 [Pseudomonadota bacterium]